MAKMDNKIHQKKTVNPKKRLGQNFLSENGVIQKLVAAAAIQPGETILEIGPGTGNLTAELLKTGNPLVAIEKDREMVTLLKEKFQNSNNFQLVEDDALGFDETKIPSPYKIAANLPFYMAAALIRKFLESQNLPLSITVIIQKEVAQRICAQKPKMNLLANSIQFYAQPKIISYISKGCFWPAPKVDCAILHLVPFSREGERYRKTAVEKFFRTMKAGFSKQRKQLANNLAKELKIGKEKANGWLQENNIKPSQRPETLSIENWISLSNNL